MAVPGVFEDVGPRWSHDGRRIAFLRRTTDRKYQLCVATSDLRKIVPLIEPELINPDRPFSPSRTSYITPDCLAWSPDDRYVVFPRTEWMTFPDGEKLPGTSLWKYDLRERRALPLALHPKDYEGELYYYRSPTWSPDGKHIAYVGEGLHGETGLFVIPASGAPTEIERGRFDAFDDTGWPAWSPDGKRLAFREGIRRSYTADAVETIRVIEPGGLRAGRVWATTPERYDALIRQQPLGAAAGSQGGPETPAPKTAGLTWSRDGSRLAFTVARDAINPLTSSIWTLNVQMTQFRPRAVPGVDPSNQDGYAAPVLLDPATTGAIRTLEGGGTRLVTIDLAGRGYSPVTSIADLPSADLDWSPNRNRVVAAGPPAKPGSIPPTTTLRLITIPR